MGKQNGKPAKEAKEPKKRPGTPITFYVEDDVYAALLKYLEGHKKGPTKASIRSVGNHSLRQFFEQEGYLSKPEESP